MRLQQNSCYILPTFSAGNVPSKLSSSKHGAFKDSTVTRSWGSVFLQGREWRRLSSGNIYQPDSVTTQRTAVFISLGASVVTPWVLQSERLTYPTLLQLIMSLINDLSVHKLQSWLWIAILRACYLSFLLTIFVRIWLLIHLLVARPRKSPAGSQLTRKLAIVSEMR